MSRKIAVNLNDSRIEKRFANWLKMVIDLISPKNLFLVSGRGTAKTTDIMADRFIDICYDMPGAWFAFVSDTYVNALKNIVPALLEGLQRKGWIEGVHYVVDKPPPAHFKLPYKPPQNYKHTISVFNGCFMVLVSMDQPSGAAGGSYQHIFGDETKYLDFAKVKKLLPALRGYPKFSGSPFYRGMTFTTDMPNIAEGEYDWILDREKDMNVEQMQVTLKSAMVINELQKEKLNEQRSGNKQKVLALDKQISRWEKRWRKVRRNSSFFKMASSFVNADVLGEQFFVDSLESLGPEEYKSAIGSFPIKAKKGERFYVNFSDDHLETNGIMPEYYERYDIGEEIRESCLAQRYLVANQPIEAGVDFGNMCSMVTGQLVGNTARVFKNFHTLVPDSLRELAQKFHDFYADHKLKQVMIFYDRSGNQYHSIKRDWATELESYLVDLGWSVTLMNKGQSTILQQEEYTLMKNIMAGDNPGLPVLKICRNGCRELVSSMNLAKTIIKDKNGSKTIHKNKTSEKLPHARLPMFSTNYSDAFKYFCFRPDWVKASARRAIMSMSVPEAV